MGIELAKAFITVATDATALGPGLKSVENAVEPRIERLSRRVNTFSDLLAGAFGGDGITTAIATFTGNMSNVQRLLGRVVGMIKESVMLAGKAEETQIAFETMLGSAAETTQTMERLTEFAAKTPFEMPGILEAARGLIQFGERGQTMMDTMKLLGNASAATSVDFGFLALVFNQVRGVGKLLTQDFRQLSTRGVISLQDIAKHFKVSRQEAQAMLSAGKITFDDFRAVLAGMSEEGGRFHNMMEKQSTSLLGLWSTLTDQINILKKEIGVPIANLLKPVLFISIKLMETVSELVMLLTKNPIWDLLSGGLMVLMKTLGLVVGALNSVLGGIRDLAKEAWGFIGEGFEITARALLPGGIGKEIADGLFGESEERLKELRIQADEAAKQMAEKRYEEEFEKKHKGSTLDEPMLEGLKALHKFRGDVADMDKGQRNRAIFGYKEEITNNSKALQKMREEGHATAATMHQFFGEGQSGWMGAFKTAKKYEEAVSKIAEHYEVNTEVAEQMVQTGKVTAKEFDEIFGTQAVKEDAGLLGTLKEIEMQLGVTAGKPMDDLVAAFHEVEKAMSEFSGAGEGLRDHLRSQMEEVTGFKSSMEGLEKQLKSLQGWTDRDFVIEGIREAAGDTDMGKEEAERQIKEYTALFDKVKGLEEKRSLESMGKQVAKGLMTPFDKFQEETKKLDKLRDAGAITASVYDRALDQAAGTLAQHQASMQEAQKGLQDAVMEATAGRMAVADMHNKIQDALIREDTTDLQLEEMKKQIKLDLVAQKQRHVMIKAIKDIDTTATLV